VRPFVLFVFGVFFLSNFLCWFALDSLLARLGAAAGFHEALAGFLVVQVVGMVIFFGTRAMGRQPGTGMGRPLISLLMIWNMLLALPTAVVGLIVLGFWFIASWGVAPAVPDPATQTGGLVAVGMPFALALVATAIAVGQLGRFRVRRMTLEFPNLPPALRGMTIAHLSDLHIGKLTRGQVLDAVVAETNRLDVDLVLLTGDLINFALEDLPKGLALLREMKSRHGLYLCEGNHDLIEDDAQFEAAAKASGLGFLLHETVTVTVNGAPVRIAGLRWGEHMARGQARDAAVAGTKSAVDDLLAQGAPEAWTILLAHHPDAFDAAAQAGVPLTLAGHTHGGQLMLTPSIGFGPWLYRYWSGHYQKGASQMVVSNGTGNWFPLRLGAPAEIIHLTLR
jgi:predicted MPP superfamily phosphohydrolase